MFEVGRVYNRRLEIHEPYGGQRYGGISTPRDRPFTFLFTGESGEQYGYEELSDGGPDHPRWVGAVCPNCHQEMHYGAAGEEKDRALQRHLGVLEEA